MLCPILDWIRLPVCCADTPCTGEVATQFKIQNSKFTHPPSYPHTHPPSYPHTPVPPLPQHPILQESFAMIDREIGDHGLPPEEYAIVRRIIHTTADFELRQWWRCSVGAIAAGMAALQRGCPIVVDVGMVRQGCQGMVQRTFGNPLITAVDLAETADPGCTRTETGLLRAWADYPTAIYVIGNAPTALQALCDRLQAAPPAAPRPALVIGVPVGFVGVEAAKAALAATPVPQIRIDGRKGGSPVAAAVLNALLVLAWEAQP
jgi:precorrin-8X/cobalt-precorrin-8 methylmutase